MRNYREQWYAERGLPYEKARLDIYCPPFQCVGSMNKVAMPEKVKPRQRQPGEDSPEDIGE